MVIGSVRSDILLLGVKETLQIQWLYKKTNDSEVNNISNSLNLNLFLCKCKSNFYS